MPKITRPGRASKAASEATTRSKAEPAPKEGNGTQPVAQASRAGEVKEAESTPKTTTPTKAPDPNLQERMEGLQGWMAELERKQARLTYFGAVAVVIAIATAGVALYFGITNKNDSATKSDVDSLKARVDALQSAVSKNTKNTQDAINNSIAQLQGSIQTLQKQQSQNASSISTLQSQAASGAFNQKAGNAATTPTTPGTTTTTPKKP